jgi:tape measure domain-containing protein
MADFRIRIIADPKGVVQGADKADKALKKVEKSSNSLASSLKSAFGFLSAGLIVRELVTLIDTFTNLQNRLKVVTKDEIALTTATENLFKISQRTRSSFAGSVELYSRLALATKDLGTESKELEQFTESLNKAVILSGASAREANAGIIQLSQGLASGTLRGDELRSVLEQLPVVADVISKSLGITRGQLREMGTQGKITAEVVLKAFKEAREELDKRFLKTVPTISQSFQVLKNNMIKLTGTFDKNTGIAAQLSKAIMFLSENLETLTKVTAIFATMLITVLAGRAIPAVTSAFNTLTAAILANPFGAAVVAITALTSAMYLFGDSVSIQEGKLATLRDVAVALFNKMLETFKAVVRYVKKNFPDVSDVFDRVFGDIELSFKGIATLILTPIGSAIGIFKGFAAVVGVIFSDGIAKAIPRAFNLAFVSAIKLVQIGLNSMIGLANKALAIFGEKGFAKIDFGASLAAKTLEAEVAPMFDAFKKGYAEGAVGVNNFINEIQENAETIAMIREEANDLALFEQEAFQDETLKSKKIFDGKMSQADLALAKQRMKSATNLFGVLREIGGVDSALVDLKTQLYERQAIITDSLRQNIISEQEALNISLAARKDYNNQLMQLELQKAQMMTQSSSNMFGSLADISRSFGGEQSKTYKRLFALQKAFSLASSLIAITTGTAKAMELGWPAGLAAAASVAAAGASIIANLASTDYAGAFQNGGSFRVGGDGGTDSQMVSFKASPNETVSVTTPGQESAKNRSSVQVQQQIKIEVINNKQDVQVQTQTQADEFGNAVISIMIDAILRNKNGASNVIQSVARRKT